MTIKELKKFCLEQIRQGNGDKEILLSNDEEGNGFHECCYAFTPAEKLISDYTPSGVRENTMLLG